MTITLRCPECKQNKTIELTLEEYDNYIRYMRGEGLIQNMLPNIDIRTRELLRGGMCGDCWDKYFGKPPWEEDESNENAYNENEE